jgi:hypothetical protein
LSLLTKGEKEELAKRNFEREREESVPKKRTYSPPLRRDWDEFERPTQKNRQPTHPLLRQGLHQERNQQVGSTYLPDGILPPREGVQRYAEAETLLRAPRRMDPIMDPVGSANTKVPQHTNMLYGPPLPVYEPALGENMAAKAFTTPRFAAFAGSPDEEGQKARHFLGLVEMHASVTRGITDSQKILIAVSNLKGAAYEWFFNTNDRHAELYGGQPLFSSFEKFRQLFLQRSGQMNTATAMAQLENVKLKKSETVATFAQKLENMFYSANLVDEQAKLYYFFRAIGDPLRSQVRGCKTLTLNQAIQDAIHFDQRMSREEQDQSRFNVDRTNEPRFKGKPNGKNTVKKAEDHSQEEKSKETIDRPPVGKARNQFPKKYDPIGNKREKGSDDNPHKDITCYNCNKKGHYSSSCGEPRKPRREKATSRVIQEEEDALNDAPEREPEFDSPALVRILEATSTPNEIRKPALNLMNQRGKLCRDVAQVNLIGKQALNPRLPSKRVPYPIDEGGFVAPVQPSGVDPEPVMAPSPADREEERRQRQRSNPERRMLPDNQPPSRPTAQGREEINETNEKFPVKWVPTEEILKHCSSDLITDLKRAAQAAVDAQEDGPEVAVHLIEQSTEQLVVAPKKKRPPLTRIAGRIGGVNGLPMTICLDSGANVGMISHKVLQESGLTEQIKVGKPTFSTADGKMAAGTGWIDTKIGIGNLLEVTTRFVVAKDLDYQILLGVKTLKPLQGIIDFNKGRFRFKLPQSGMWRSLPLIDKEAAEQVGLAVATMHQGNVPQYVEEIIQALLAEHGPLSREISAGQPHHGGLKSPTISAEERADCTGLPDLISFDNSDPEWDTILEERQDGRQPPYERISGQPISHSCEEDMPELVDDDSDDEREDESRHTRPGLTAHDSNDHEWSAETNAASAHKLKKLGAQEDLLGDEFKELTAHDQAPNCPQKDTRKEDKLIEPEVPLNEIKHPHRIESGVLLESATEAEDLYQFLLEKEVISKETKDELFQECCEFFTNPGNNQLLYPIQNAIRPLIPRTYHVEDLYPQERTDIENQLSPKRNDLREVDEDSQMPELLQYESGEENDMPEAEDLLDEIEDYKLVHGFESGVLLQSATEAKNLLRFLLKEKVILKQEGAEQAKRMLSVLQDTNKPKPSIPNSQCGQAVATTIVQDRKVCRV